MSYKIVIDSCGELPAALLQDDRFERVPLGLEVGDYQILDEKQARTEEARWLKENCWKYGFILRYPTDKTEETGIIFEPWHYRYVGEKAAKEIMEQGICLEEYLDRGQKD